MTDKKAETESDSQEEEKEAVEEVKAKE